MDDEEDEKTSVHLLVTPPATDKSQTPSVIVVSGKESVGKMFKLTGEMVIGRVPSADIYLDDDGISRKHARIVVRPDGSVHLEDLGSTNGTFHQGQRIDRRKLEDGDKIQIGSTIILKFSYQDAIDEALQKNLYDSATRDPLTKLYNKKHFADVLRKELAYASRNGVELSLVIFDVDHFKRVNDTFGHPCGDHVLARLAATVGGCIRTEDLLARYGGEEFALVLREISEDNAISCAERIRATVAAEDFIFRDTKIPITVSLGVATFDGTNHPRPDDLVAAADAYLYKAKRGGRNRVEAKKISG